MVVPPAAAHLTIPAPTHRVVVGGTTVVSGVVTSADGSALPGHAVVLQRRTATQARDVGLHLVIARHSGGAARALYEPVLQTLRDLATPTLVLSGSPDEGPLVAGVRPAPAPPGRGRLVTRARGVGVVQIAWTPPAV